jgi:hypothetical protein
VPARRSSHTQGGEPRATLYFLCKDTKFLSGPAATPLIDQVISVAVSDTHRYKSFCAFVEDSGKTGAARLFSHRTFALPGYAFWATRAQVDEVLREKLRHEAPHKRVPGAKSIRPEAILTRETYGIFIGSRAFLFEAARLCLEETGALREKLLDLAQVICGLSPAYGRIRNEDYVQVNLWEKQFYPGNFDALVESISRTRLSTRQVLARLGIPETEDML